MKSTSQFIVFWECEREILHVVFRLAFKNENSLGTKLVSFVPVLWSCAFNMAHEVCAESAFIWRSLNWVKIGRVLKWFHQKKVSFCFKLNSTWRRMVIKQLRLAVLHRRWVILATWVSKFVATYHNLEVMVWVCVMIGLLTSF